MAAYAPGVAAHDNLDAMPGQHRIHHAAQIRGVAACLLLIGLLIPSSCWPYRPFIATDAAVADPQEVEIELG